MFLTFQPKVIIPWFWSLLTGIVGIIAGLFVIILGVQGLIMGVLEIVSGFRGGGFGVIFPRGDKPFDRFTAAQFAYRGVVGGSDCFWSAPAD